MKPELRSELLRRAEKDQAARSEPDAETLTSVDAENLAWLRDLTQVRDGRSVAQGSFYFRPRR